MKKPGAKNILWATHHATPLGHELMAERLLPEITGALK